MTGFGPTLSVAELKSASGSLLFGDLLSWLKNEQRKWKYWLLMVLA